MQIRPSVSSFVTLPTNAYSSFVNSRILIRMSEERAGHLLQENEAMFSKIIFFKKFVRNFPKITFLHTTSALLAVE